MNMTTYTTEQEFNSSRICSTETYYEPAGPFYTQLYPADSQQTDSKVHYNSSKFPFIF